MIGDAYGMQMVTGEERPKVLFGNAEGQWFASFKCFLTPDLRHRVCCTAVDNIG